MKEQELEKMKQEAVKSYRVDKPHGQSPTGLSLKSGETPKHVSFSSVERFTTKQPLNLDKVIWVEIRGKKVPLVRTPARPSAENLYTSAQTTYTKKPNFEMLHYTPPQFERVPVVKYVKYAKQTREKKLPVVAPKETRWEFAKAKPPAVVFREGKMTDYIPPQFERVSIVRLQELARQKNLPIAKGETAIVLKPKETPYKETVAREGFKTAQMLEEFLKKTQPKTETKQDVLKPIRKLENLIKEIPEEAKNDPEIRRRLVEIIRDLKKISSEARFRNASDDLRVLDAKVDELKTLLGKKYSRTAAEKTTPQTKKKKSNK
jgi:hypothetical protein